MNTITVAQQLANRAYAKHSADPERASVEYTKAVQFWRGFITRLNGLWSFYDEQMIVINPDGDAEKLTFEQYEMIEAIIRGEAVDKVETCYGYEYHVVNPCSIMALCWEV